MNAPVRADEPNRGGEISLESMDPQVALSRLKVPEGYEVNLFASERDFPELAKPVALAFDGRGRLWVSTMPSYPQYLPPSQPDDKLLILEDTDSDGKADKCTVFADRLYIPTGFELGDGGAYIGQQPNLMFAQDIDGDDVADTRRILLHGFGTEDSHHAIHTFVWGPDGGLYFQEGTFFHSQVETPYGPVRLQDAGIFRYRPDTEWLEVFVSYSFANPWGHIFDRWGQNFIADASGGSNYFGTAITGHVDYPRKHPNMKVFTTVVRPTSGCEIVSSRHFPDEAQGNFIVNNCIGFQGIKQHRVIEEDSGFTSKEVEPLLQSSDPNFRPVDLEFGPDGALYVADWFNPLIGHMQYSLRDPRRDHGIGRVWRISYPSRPLVKTPRIAGLPIPELLELLKTYEDRTRYRVRVELREHAPQEVAEAVHKWIDGLDTSDAEYEHHVLEGLWTLQAVNVFDRPLLERELRSENYHVRAAATRVLRYWLDRIDSPIELLRVQVNDPHPRVRIEAVLACSFIPTAEAAELALESLKHPRDYYLDYVLRETMATLEPYWKPSISAGRPFAANNPAGVRYVLDSLPTGDLTKLTPGEAVYEALLTRIDTPLDQRRDALRGLAGLSGSGEVAELVKRISQTDSGSSADRDHVLFDMGRILMNEPAADLDLVRKDIARLATEGRRSATRQVGFAGLLAADHSTSQAWELATGSVRGLCDLLDSLSLVEDDSLRSQLYPQAAALLNELPAGLQGKSVQGVPGRTVRIELPGPRRTLTLAEVEVFSDGVNVAPKGKAKQQSTAFGAPASRAIDGNKSGMFGEHGQTHTQEGVTDPWWELDLGKQVTIESIDIWNRTEENRQYAGRLDGFTLRVLDDSGQVVFESTDNAAPAEHVRFDLSSQSQERVQRSAIQALSNMPGHGGEVFAALARLVEAKTQQSAAISALGRIPAADWPQTNFESLADSVLAFVASAPPAERTSRAVRDALKLSNELAARLPTDTAERIRARVADLAVEEVTLRAVPHKMAFDRKAIVVSPGKPMEIIFENPDVMPHNLILTEPGQLEAVGLAAERMAILPDAFERNFVPDSSSIIFATRLLQTGESHRVSFLAPSEPGEYPFVCTFPGHWRTMNGLLVVTPDVKAYLAANPQPEPLASVEARSFVKAWQYDELAAALPRAESGRSFARGKELFTAAACITCHRMNNTGGIIGPDLGLLAADLSAGKLKPTDVLWEMVDPSRVIKEKFRSQIILTDDGRQITGIIISENDKELRVMVNPLAECEPQVVPRASIDERLESKISMMPAGLLNTLTEDEILDLIAYIKSGGSADHPAFRQ